jgi:hypothetical protein
MTYRTAAPRAKPPELETSLRCTRCDIPVPPSKDPQCPQCLRRTAIVDSKALTPAEKKIDILDAPTGTVVAGAQLRRDIWPYTRLCPICGERDVDDSRVFLRIGKTASTVASVTRSLFVSVSSCTDCRARVVRLELIRLASGLAAVTGFALLLAFFAGGIAGIALGTCGLALFIGALAFYRSKSESLRALLDSAGITSHVAELVPTPRGLFEQENATLYAHLPKGHTAIDLLDALRLPRALR